MPEFDIKMALPSERIAQIACASLEVDPEPNRSGLSKHLSVDGRFLIGRFTAPQAKQLRVGLASFLDLLILVLQTVQHFDIHEMEQE
eukprot:m.311114 g.311114  ORF g.311114 m.311114 type:complete len:87 (+) comp60057_c0_seq1:83-343(+)